MQTWIPYTSEDMTLDSCKTIARELRAGKHYIAVRVRKKAPENGREFGRVYVLIES